MAQEPCHILLIDPDPATAAHVQQHLVGASALLHFSSVQLDSATSVEAGLALLQTQLYQALLLEITLFDEFHAYQRSHPHRSVASSIEADPSTADAAEGRSPESPFELLSQPESEFKSSREVPDVPIIIISELDEEVLAVRAIEGGAYGYLLTSRLTGNALIYSLRFAIEKHAQLKSLIRTPKYSQGQVQEMKDWEQLVRRDGAPSLTAQLFDAGSLRETLPDIFAELVEDYGRLLDQALEYRAYRVESSPDNPMQSLAEQLGFLKASPRDVVEMHTHALRAKTTGVLPEKATAYITESRLTVLGVMGDLVTYYRRYFIGLSKRHRYSREESS